MNVSGGADSEGGTLVTTQSEESLDTSGGADPEDGTLTVTQAEESMDASGETDPDGDTHASPLLGITTDGAEGTNAEDNTAVETGAGGDIAAETGAESNIAAEINGESAIDTGYQRTLPANNAPASRRHPGYSILFADIPKDTLTNPFIIADNSDDEMLDTCEFNEDELDHYAFDDADDNVD
ncbi:hypothetical protein BGX33_000997 [Mortierella sp. NVP41]|nr:hypothetical protein BGX33_000997 [Mortierella sp. NVP41]